MTMARLEEEARARHASTFGMQADKVQTIRLEMNKLLQQGSLVDVRVFGISMFSQGATLEEYGIPAADLRSLRLSKGRKNTLPEPHNGRLKSLGVRFRQNFTKNSYEITGFSPWRYISGVPKTMPDGTRRSPWDVWLAQHNILSAQLQDVVNEILDNYVQIREWTWDTYFALGLEAWDARIAREPDFPHDKRTYATDIAQKAVNNMPGPEKIRKGIYATFTTGHVLNVQAIEAKELELERERIRNQAAQIEVDDATRAAQAMHEVALTHARNTIAEMGSPFKQVFTQLGAQIYKDVQEIIAVIKDRGYLPGRTAEKARGLQELYSLMAIEENVQLEEALRHLTEALEAPAAVVEGDNRRLKYDATSVARALMEIGEITHLAAQEAKDMGMSGFDAMEL